MSGNLVLRSMLVTEEIKAGVIWAGAVYSYEDFAKYRISDSSYVARPMQQIIDNPNRDNNDEIVKLREDSKNVDFSNNYWKAISLTQNINYLKNPIQLHHSINDEVVNIGYSRDLEEVLKNNYKNYEYFEYAGGGHNITGFYFNEAMQRTVEFFKKNL
jgi:dipeptidyl aminopeptidase/acylaminoacyl peptidase